MKGNIKKKDRNWTKNKQMKKRFRGCWQLRIICLSKGCMDVGYPASPSNYPNVLHRGLRPQKWKHVNKEVKIRFAFSCAKWNEIKFSSSYHLLFLVFLWILLLSYHKAKGNIFTSPQIDFHLLLLFLQFRPKKLHNQQKFHCPTTVNSAEHLLSSNAMQIIIQQVSAQMNRICIILIYKQHTSLLKNANIFTKINSMNEKKYLLTSRILYTLIYLYDMTFN